MKKLDFETGMNELETLVREMERGEMKLEASIAAYEKGMKLAKSLDQLLSEGEARIVALRESENGAEEEDISDEVRT